MSKIHKYNIFFIIDILIKTREILAKTKVISIYTIQGKIGQNNVFYVKSQEKFDQFYYVQLKFLLVGKTKLFIGRFFNLTDK